MLKNVVDQFAKNCEGSSSDGIPIRVVAHRVLNRISKSGRENLLPASRINTCDLYQFCIRATVHFRPRFIRAAWQYLYSRRQVVKKTEAVQISHCSRQTLLKV